MRKQTVGVFLFAICALTSSASASILIGNLPQSSATGDISIGKFSSSFAGGQGAYQFTIPSTSYTLDSVNLILTNAFSGGSPLVTIREANNGVDPGSLLATLTNPVISSNLMNQYTFLPAGVVTLQANTSYWLLVDHNTNNVSFNWNRSNPSLTPSGIASFAGFRYSNSDGATYFDSPTTLPSFQINGTVVSGIAGVPEASSAIVWCLLGITIVCTCRSCAIV